MQIKASNQKEDRDRLQRELDEKDDIETALIRQLLQLLLRHEGYDSIRSELEKVDRVCDILSDIESVNTLHGSHGESRSGLAKLHGHDMTKKEWARFKAHEIIKRHEDARRIPLLEARIVELKTTVD